MILADIGNTHFHIFDNGEVLHLSYEDAISLYFDKKIYYISVKSDFVLDNPNWEDISKLVYLDGEYKGMGVDRKALCLSRDNGIFVDAGSAITVDIVIDRVYIGGFILLGINAYLKAYREISNVLNIELNRDINLEVLPKNTVDSISYGIIAPIKSIIDSYDTTLPLYFTGGDGEFLSSFFEDSFYNDKILFDGLMSIINSKKLQ